MHQDKKTTKYLWITWESQRRSLELAKAFGAELIIIESTGIFRYIKCLYRTLVVVMRSKPNVLLIQNPSMILAVFCVYFIKPLLSIPIVIDRHSNFLLTPKKRSWFKEFLFNFLSYATIRHAELTIVTNDDLAHVVRVLGGRVFVLPDKIPLLSPARKRDFFGEKKVLVVSSFAEDEPYEEVWQAFQKSEMDCFSVYMSGNPKKISKLLPQVPQNIVLTGFLSNDDYVDLLFQVDVVVVLTKMDYTLLCGCYEAISAEKPVITSNSAVLNQLFSGALFVDNNPDSIAAGVCQIFKELPLYKIQSCSMKKELSEQWNERFMNLKKLVNSLAENK